MVNLTPGCRRLMPHGDEDQKLSITVRQAAECRKMHELK